MRRFLLVVLSGAVLTGLAVWWSVTRIDRATMVLRVTLGAAFLGGLARLLAVAVSGWPHPVFLGALGVELVLVPVLVLWQAKVASVAAGRLARHTPVRPTVETR